MAGWIHLRLTAGQGPVASGEVVVRLPVVVVAAGAGSGLDWTQSSGMGSGHQSQLKKKEEKLVGSLDDYWWASFDCPWTGMVAGQGPACPLGIVRATLIGLCDPDMKKVAVMQWPLL